MKKLIWQLILPLTIISFACFTKWWYVYPIDAPGSVLEGFPLPYVCNGWHTSLSLQIFIAELIIDLFVYFSFWFVLVLFIDKYLFKITVHRFLTKVVLILSCLIIALYVLFAINPDNIFYFRRNFDMEIIDMGYGFIWEKAKGPDYNKYLPEN